MDFTAFETKAYIVKHYIVFEPLHQMIDHYLIHARFPFMGQQQNQIGCMTLMVCFLLATIDIAIRTINITAKAQKI